MMPFAKLFTKKKSPHILSVSISKDAVTVCHLPKNGVAVEHKIIVINDNYLDAIANIHNLPNISGSCQLILPSDFYQITQVDKPNVPDNELHQALKWQVKDLVTIPPDDMVVDYFDMPLKHSSGVKKINVVCAAISKLQPVLLNLHKNNITVTNIITEEFAFANLVADHDEAQLLVCQQPNEDVFIIIVKAGQLFFYRRLRGMAQIGKKSQEELLYGTTDSLSLEIQRSSDFFERQLKQAPINNIQVLLPIEQEAFIARKLAENSNVSVEILKMPAGFSDEREYAAVVGPIFAEQCAQLKSRKSQENNDERIAPTMEPTS
jgi:MSHA biogenesis protein MshI